MKTKKETQRWLVDKKDAIGAEIRFYQGQLDNLYSHSTARKCIIFFSGERNTYQILQNRLIDEEPKDLYEWASTELLSQLENLMPNSSNEVALSRQNTHRGKQKALATFMQWMRK